MESIVYKPIINIGYKQTHSLYIIDIGYRKSALHLYSVYFIAQIEA